MFSTLKFRKRLSTVIALLLICFTSINSHSADVEGHVNSNLEVTKNTSSAGEDEESFGSGMVGKFRYFVDWIEKELQSINDEYFRPQSKKAEEIILESSIEPEPVIVLEEPPSKPLNLSIPKIEHVGTMSLDEGQKINFPDMFSEQMINPSIKEDTGASFGGRILMDEAEIEGMKEYRFNEVKDAIRGAELSLEFKTN